jgi:hypothetical protein
MPLRAATVAKRLGLGPDYNGWLTALEELGPPVEEVRLPLGKATARLLDELGVADTDSEVILQNTPSPAETPEVWWLLERAYHGVQLDVGNLVAMRPMPSLPSALGAIGRCFWIYIFLAAVPDIRRWHRSQAISDSVSADTLADLGRHISLHRKRTGHTGLDTPWWIALHFKGALYALGRLQFAPFRLKTGLAGPLFWYAQDSAPGTAPGFRHGDPALGLHIPESGPMTPAACDASFASARVFFERHFPEYADAVVTCTSWLMDDQLLDWLPPDSNIVQFQRRFELVPGSLEADASPIQFVFGRPLESLDELPQRTTLERALVRHIKQGNHWRLRTGWLKLPVP